MSHNLPSIVSSDLSLADIYPSSLACLGLVGFVNSLELPRSRVVVLVLIDGLGALNFSQNKAYARFLNSHSTDAPKFTTVFPSTTAVAMATLTTAQQPAQHGITGYRSLNPETGDLVNQLTGITEQMLAGGWLAAAPLYSGAEIAGVDTAVVSHTRFASTPLTRMLHDGADQVGANTLDERVDEVITRAQKPGKHFILLYVSELDERAHKFGTRSDQWCNELEAVDSALSRLSSGLPKDAGALVFADHGIVDVPVSQQTLFRSDAPEFQEVYAIGGEPRCLQLYVNDLNKNEDSIRDYFNRLCGPAAVVFTKEELRKVGWLGQGDAMRAERLGDLFVLAQSETAFYDECDKTRSGREMIGQHGGVSDVERLIPLIKLGNFVKR